MDRTSVPVILTGVHGTTEVFHMNMAEFNNATRFEFWAQVGVYGTLLQTTTFNISHEISYRFHLQNPFLFDGHYPVGMFHFQNTQVQAILQETRTEFYCSVRWENPDNIVTDYAREDWNTIRATARRIWVRPLALPGGGNDNDGGDDGGSEDGNRPNGDEPRPGLLPYGLLPPDNGYMEHGIRPETVIDVAENGVVHHRAGRSDLNLLVEVDEDYFVVGGSGSLLVEGGGDDGLNEREVPREGRVDVVHVEIPEAVVVDEVEVLDRTGEVDEDFGLAWLFDEVTGMARGVDEDYFVGGSGSLLVEAGGESGLNEGEVPRESRVDVVHVEIPQAIVVDEVEVLDMAGEVDEDFGLAWLFDEVTGVAGGVDEDYFVGGSGSLLVEAGGEGGLNEGEVPRESRVDVVHVEIPQAIVVDEVEVLDMALAWLSWLFDEVTGVAGGVDEDYFVGGSGSLLVEARGEGGLNEGEVPKESRVDVVHVEVPEAIVVDEVEVLDMAGEVDEDFGLAWLFDEVTGVAGGVDEDYFVGESGSSLVEAGGEGGLNEGEVPRENRVDVVHVEVPDAVAVDELEVLDMAGKVDEDFGLAWLFDEVTGVAGEGGLSLLATKVVKVDENYFAGESDSSLVIEAGGGGGLNEGKAPWESGVDEATRDKARKFFDFVGRRWSG